MSLKKIKFIKKFFFNKEFFKFILIGILSTLINFITFITFINTFSLLELSSLAGYSSGLLNSYFLGKKWVFNNKNPNTLIIIIKFLIVYIVGGIGMTLIISVLVRLSFDYIISWCFGVLFSCMNNYMGSIYFFFKN